MAKSPIERYEQILAADPSSLVFVELAKALIEANQLPRAVEVSSEGVGHHPDSILGHVLWGKALLLSGAPAEAMEQFEKSAAIEPENPYAYNLVAEILIQKRLFRSALPILRKAVALQPSDAKVRQWLDQAMGESHDSLVPIADQAFSEDKTTAFIPSWAAPAATGKKPLMSTTRAPPKPATAPPVPAASPRPPPLTGSTPRPGPPPLGKGTGGPRPPPPPRTPSHPPPPPAVPRTPSQPPSPPPRSAPSDRMRAVDLLGDLPDAPGGAGPMRSIPSVSADKAKQIAEEYESKLREEYSLKHDVPVSWFRRHWLPLTLAVAFAFAGAVGAGGWILYRQHYNQQHQRDFLERAQGGLLLDTEASLTGASHQLAEVLGTNPKDPLARALSAQTAATLFREYGGPTALREQATDLLGDAKLFRVAPDAAWTARYLLADDPKPLAPEILALPAEKAGPWVDYLAGRLLLGRGQAVEALSRFNLALKKAAAHVPTLLAVGDYYLKAGDNAQAAEFFQLAHNASGQSVGAAVGLAEAHLALRQAGAAGAQAAQDDEKSLAAVSASGVPPAWRLRLDMATARVLAVEGQHDKAAARIREGLAAHAEDQGAYVAALADVDLLGGRYLDAEAAEQRALARAPKDPDTLERYAQILLGLGRYRQLLAKVQAVVSDSRTLHVMRARADYALGECGAARHEVEATRRGETIPAGGAMVLALCDAGDGQVAQGRAALQQLAALPHAGSTVLVALGDLDQKAGDLKAAAAHYKQAAAADPIAYEPHCALGRLLLASGKQTEGLAELDAALKLNSDHAEAQVAYGLALLGAGKASAAMPHLNNALSAAPDDEQVNLALARTTLALNLLPDALRYATRATSLSPDDPEAHRWRGKVASAAKQKKLAQSEGKLVAKLEKKKRDDAKAKARALAKRKHS